jgi:enoyl-CoA hydratase
VQNDIYAEQNGSVYSIFINRPKKRNALTTDALIQLGNLLKLVEHDDDIRLIVLQGKGEQAFSAGFEINEISRNSKDVEDMLQPFVDLLMLMNKYPKPIISLVQGYALGGGCVLSSATDITVATKDAQFGLPELGIGLGVLLTPIIESIGKRKAMELLLTRKRIDALTAYEYGLINHVAEDKEEANKIMNQLISTLLGNAPKAMEVFLPAAKQSASLHYQESIEYLNKINVELMLGDEFTVGIKCFQKKIPAPWVI